MAPDPNTDFINIEEINLSKLKKNKGKKKKDSKKREDNLEKEEEIIDELKDLKLEIQDRTEDEEDEEKREIDHEAIDRMAEDIFKTKIKPRKRRRTKHEMQMEALEKEERQAELESGEKGEGFGGYGTRKGVIKGWVTRRRNQKRRSDAMKKAWRIRNKKKRKEKRKGKGILMEGGERKFLDKMLGEMKGFKEYEHMRNRGRGEFYGNGCCPGKCNCNGGYGYNKRQDYGGYGYNKRQDYGGYGHNKKQDLLGNGYKSSALDKRDHYIGQPPPADLPIAKYGGRKGNKLNNKQRSNIAKSSSKKNNWIAFLKEFMKANPSIRGSAAMKAAGVEWRKK